MGDDGRCRQIQLRVVEGAADARDRDHLEACADCRSFAGFARAIPGLLEADSDEMPPPASDEAIGVSGPWSADPSRYTVGDVLVRGGMGRIRAGWDRRLNRPVAVKELRRREAGAERRFLREALITARLQHPAVVPVYEAGRWPDGRAFYVMKLVDGRSLDAVIADARSLEERLALLPNAITVAEAVAYAHNEGVIHRDLKPGNVLVGPFGETVVIDWGLAKDLSAPASEELPTEATIAADGLTVDGAVLGTPAYMPPEQARGEAADKRSDVYSLGALLYHVLAGSPPYRGSSEEALRGVLAGPPAPLVSIEPRAPSDLVTIVDKAMARAPADRFASAKEIAEQLTRWQTGQLVSVHRYSPRALLTRFLRRHRTAVAAGLAGILAVAGTGALSVRRVVREKEAARRVTHELMLEQGRHELLSGRPERALAILREVYGAGHRTPVLGLLFARLAAVLPLATLPGEGALTSAAFSPDGRRVAAGTREGVVRVWDVGSGRVLHILRFGDCDVTSVAFRPDGAHLLAASDDGIVVAWDMRTGARVASFVAHRSGVRSATYDPTGSLVVTAGADAAVRLWHADTGRAAGELVGHSAEVFCAAYSPDGTRIVTASRDGTARVWHVGRRAELRRLPHAPHATFAAYSPDGTRIVTTGSMQPVSDVRVPYAFEYPVIVWDAVTGKPLHRLLGHRDQVRSAAFDSKQRVVTASEDESAKIWDIESSAPLATLSGHTKAVRAAAFSPDGATVVTASHDRTVRLWDVTRQMRFASVAVSDGELTRVAYRPDGRRILVGARDGYARIVDPVGRAVEQSFAHPREVTFAAFTHGGERVLTGAVDGVVRSWHASSGRLLSSFPFGRLDPRVLDHHPSGPSVLTSTGDGNAAIWDPDTGARRIVLPVVGVVAGAFRPDGARVVTADARSAVEIWDAATGRRVGSLPHQDGAIFQVRYSPDGARLATGGWDETVRVWDAETGQLLASLAGHRKGIRALAFSPDGAFIATGSGDRSVKVWDGDTGHLLASFEGHLGDVLDVTYSPDGARLLSAGGDGNANVWDVHLAGANEIERLVQRPVPWQLVQGRLLAVPMPPALDARMRAFP